jgi:hypothetical protein
MQAIGADPARTAQRVLASVAGSAAPVRSTRIRVGPLSVKSGPSAGFGVAGSRTFSRHSLPPVTGTETTSSAESPGA